MNEETEITRGQEAARLLENDLLIEALAAIKDRCRTKSELSLPSQPEVREAAYWLMRAAVELETHLTTFATTGKLASIAKSEREAQELRERELNEWDGSASGTAG